MPRRRAACGTASGYRRGRCSPDARSGRLPHSHYRVRRATTSPTLFACGSARTSASRRCRATRPPIRASRSPHDLEQATHHAARCPLVRRQHTGDRLDDAAGVDRRVAVRQRDQPRAIACLTARRRAGHAIKDTRSARATRDAHPDDRQARGAPPRHPTYAAMPSIPASACRQSAPRRLRHPVPPRRKMPSHPHSAVSNENTSACIYY